MGADRHRRVRTYALGVTPNQYRDDSARLSEALRMAENERAQRMAFEQRLGVMEERLETVQRQLGMVNIELDRFRTFFNRIEDRFGSIMQSEPVSNDANSDTTQRLDGTRQ